MYFGVITKNYFCSFSNTMSIKKGDEIELLIEGFAFGGKGISKINNHGLDYVVFTQNAITGQRVKVKIVKKKKSFAEARILELLEPSSLQNTTPFQAISGAPYISLSIETQHQFKQSTTLDLFERIGEIEAPSSFFDAFIASPASHHYRNKMEYSFSSIRHDIHNNEEFDDDFALGFKHSGTWWKVENLDKSSGMFDAEFEDNLKNIRHFLHQTGLEAWHPPQKKGFFRHLVVRKSFCNNQLLINLVTSSEHLARFNPQEFSEFLVGLFGKRLAGCIHTVNTDVADRAKLENGSSKLILGNATINENILGLNFEISMESFFQTNPASAERLYQKVIDYVSEDQTLSNGVVMDLFCGTGTIGQLVAKEIENTSVIGVDIVESAIENAKKNAQVNQIKNIQFFSQDVGKFLTNNPEFENKINTIVLDPPRAGIAPKSLKKVIQLKANRIIYVSCNPATQARDAKTLRENGYELIKFSLVDQFPHTSHIESIMLFKRNRN